MAVKQALLSVSDKNGLIDFAQSLLKAGVQLISTGGTAAVLRGAGLAVTPVEEITGSPEMLGGRVKSLHPRIHGGILARRDDASQLRELMDLAIAPIDLVVVNLYPFGEATASPDCSLAQGLENIDIGGPALLRAAAKNFQAVIPVCDPADYREVAAGLVERGDITLQQRRRLAAKAFARTAAYDAAISSWLIKNETAPEYLTLVLERGLPLRYGENPHQQGALYRLPAQSGTLAAAEPLQGKVLSYNNYNDADAALALVTEFNQPAAVAVKHAVPCGVGLGDSAAEAFNRARQGDPISIFGGIVAFNRPVDGVAASAMKDTFLEVVIAPAFTAEARALLAKQKNLRLLALPSRHHSSPTFRSIAGGLLVQAADQAGWGQWQAAGKIEPATGWEQDGCLAWLTAKHAKSNAIVVSKGKMTLGIGSGCTSRIAAATIALQAAGEQALGAVLASDGFIPFPDVVEAAAAAGISVIIQPGGSKGDEEAIAAADQAGIAMLFTGIRHFRH